MHYRNKKLIAVTTIMAFAFLTMTGCLKEGDDTIVLPLPNGKIPYELIAENLQDSLRLHGFVINEGIEPPNIEGRYVSAPMVLRYASDEYENSFYDLYMTFANQHLRGMIKYNESQRDTVIGKATSASVIGSGDAFTMYCFQNVSANTSQGDTLYRCTTATVVSGNITPTGIANCQYAFVVLDRWGLNEYYLSQLPKAETYRIWNDGNNFADKLSK